MKRPLSPSPARAPGPATLASLWKLAPVRDSVAVLPAPQTVAPPPGMPVVDLFCGAGGYSCGASLAGHHVALAIDCDNASLKIHAANHPHAAHARVLLGPDTEERVLELIRRHVPAKGPWVLHGSPPCVKFSHMRSITKGIVIDAGMRLVVWYIELVKKLDPPYWTFEQVAMPPVRDYLSSEGLTYHAFDFSLYGVPQTRTRCLAGTPSLIHALRDNTDLRVAAPVSPAMLLTPPPTATRIRASGGKCVPKFYRSIHVPTWCLLTAGKPVYVDDAGRCVRVMTADELLVIQTFPRSYRMPSHLCSESDRVRLIGNSVPPLISRLLLSSLKP